MPPLATPNPGTFWRGSAELVEVIGPHPDYTGMVQVKMLVWAGAMNPKRELAVYPVSDFGNGSLRQVTIRS